MSSSAELIGHTIKDTYQIDAFLGEGGPSVVYRGTDLLLNVPVAIKRLKRSPTMQDGSSLAERFLREGRTQASLVHQNIVGIRAVLEEAGEFYIVMEFIEGLDLAQILAKWPLRRLPFTLIGPIFTQVLAGLGYAHEQNVIHRDIKPSNILVRPEGRTKIADFGIARVVSDTRITQTGYLVGTVAYMAPEQLKGSNVDHRVDIYSLGITLFECLTGFHPFRATGDEVGSFEMMSNHLYVQPPRPSSLRDGIPLALEEVVLRAIAKEPDARFATCAAFSSALKEALEQDGIVSSHTAQGLSSLPIASAAALDPKHSPVEHSTEGASRKEAETDDYHLSSAPGVSQTPPSSPKGGTGAFDREALQDFSEERPSGVLVSVSAAMKDTGLSLPRSAPTQKGEPNVVHEESHELNSSVQGNPPGAGTSAFFREESVSTGGTGAFNRESEAQEQVSGVDDGTNSFDRGEAFSPETVATSVPTMAEFSEALLASEKKEMDHLASSTKEHLSEPMTSTLSDTETPASLLRNTLLMVGLLIAGLVVGSGIVWRLFGREQQRKIATNKPNGEKLPPSQRQNGILGRTNPRLTPKVPHAPDSRRPSALLNAAQCPRTSGEMVFVPSGSFWQGEKARRRRRNDRPPRRVEISSFCMDRFEVTGALYQSCVQKGQCAPTKKRTPAHLPVRFVSWNQANNFCRAVQKRLPREAEWEYALRRQTSAKYLWSNRRGKPRCNEVVWRGCRSRLPFAPDASKRQIHGINDLLGNVWEWVHDCYDRKAYSKTSAKDPLFDSLRCRFRSLRGGSFRSGLKALSSFYRAKQRPRQTRLDIGFRCVSKALISRQIPQMKQKSRSQEL